MFVHGLSASWRWWRARPAIPLARAPNACHLLDLPRFTGTLRPETVAELLSPWADRAELRQNAARRPLVGRGGRGKTGGHAPDLVQALVLVAAVGMPSRRRLGEYARPLFNTLRATNPLFLSRIAADAVQSGPGSARARRAVLSARGHLERGSAHSRADTSRLGGSEIRSSRCLLPLNGNGPSLPQGSRCCPASVTCRWWSGRVSSPSCCWNSWTSPATALAAAQWAACGGAPGDDGGSSIR